MKKLLLLAFIAAACNRPQPAEHSPEASLADLKLYKGLEVKTFASEPMFSNPTNIAVDSKGRVWVCEAYNYRNALNPKNPTKKEGDRIMILEDTDNDGVADKSKVFYQGTDVNAALGISVLGNKVYVSCSPNVFVFTDENGDDKPDKKEILFTGIQGDQHDHGMHTFTFGPDGRLYFNMGNEGKLLRKPDGDTITDIHGRKIVTNGKPFRQGMALRMNTDGSNVEVLGHNFRNNFELTVDPYGTVWQSDNDDDGNKGTRINYVMEQGNYGYTDEMTGAGWSVRRTNMEQEIPFRHWHLNDPGVVPNVLQTGSGSPSGITTYEGNMLPEVFQGQVIHAEPGHNVVRTYVFKPDGAGYNAEIVNLLEGQKDQWFRPVDVTAAPDGSLFIADWYDPGVGGHQVGDLDRGRIYRVATPGESYRINQIDLKTPDGAVEALLNPNNDIKYQAWQALQRFGAQAEPALTKIWKTTHPRHRATVLWLLLNLENKDTYFDQALGDADENIRILALRAAKQQQHKIESVVAQLAGDASPAVRREVALTLRGMNTKTADESWTKLAMAYDGKDRWYLEALGIGADGLWDQRLANWKTKVGNGWKTGAARDVVWRSRGKETPAMLAGLIRESDEGTMLRYFRAFDFQQNPQAALASLALESDGEKLLYALKHLKPGAFKPSPALLSKVNHVLDQYQGKTEFVEIVSAFGLKNRANDLLQLGLQYPDSVAGKEAMKVLLQWDQIPLLNKVLAGNNKANAIALVKSLWPHVSNPRAMRIMDEIIMDEKQDIDVRKLAVRTFGGPWETEDHLLQLAAENKIPEALHVTAAGVFQTAWRANIREDGAKYIKLPGAKDGQSLPSVSVLAVRNGAAASGQKVFENLCANCHRVNGNGVDFGPDLSEIGSKLSKEAVYNAILYPDQGISFGYEAWRLRMKDGSSAFGKIVSQSEDKVVVQYMTNTQTLNRGEVVTKEKMENSLMPANLHTNMTETELVDLVEYLGTLKTKK